MTEPKINKKETYNLFEGIVKLIIGLTTGSLILSLTLISNFFKEASVIPFFFSSWAIFCVSIICGLLALFCLAYVIYHNEELFEDKIFFKNIRFLEFKKRILVPNDFACMFIAQILSFLIGLGCLALFVQFNLSTIVS